MSKAPHIVWPAAIIGLLVLSGITTFAILWASQSDGGAQVVDDYYRKSVTWDSSAAAREASESLGWALHVEMDASGDSPFGVVTIVDRDGAAIQDLSGSVSVTRPQSAASYGHFELVVTAEDAGRYRFEFPYSGRGLWDLTFEARQNDIRFSEKVRIEI